MPAPASGLWPGMAGTRRLTTRATNIFASPGCEAGAGPGAFREAPERYGTAGAPRPRRRPSCFGPWPAASPFSRPDRAVHVP